MLALFIGNDKAEEFILLDVGLAGFKVGGVEVIHKGWVVGIIERGGGGQGNRTNRLRRISRGSRAQLWWVSG